MAWELSVNGETPIAILPMYDFPWTAAANDALWAAISARLAEAGVFFIGNSERNGPRFTDAVYD